MDNILKINAITLTPDQIAHAYQGQSRSIKVNQGQSRSIKVNQGQSRSIKVNQGQSRSIKVKAA
jgi:hypothetical protein